MFFKSKDIHSFQKEKIIFSPKLLIPSSKIKKWTYFFVNHWQFENVIGTMFRKWMQIQRKKGFILSFINRKFKLHNKYSLYIFILHCYNRLEKIELLLRGNIRILFLLMTISWLIFLFCVKQFLIKTRNHITDGISFLFFSMIVSSTMTII